MKIAHVAMHKHISSGVSLIEALVAIGLVAVFASTLFIYMGNQLLTSVKTNQSLTVLPLANEGLVAARAIRDIGWSALATGTHGIAYTSSTWGFQGTSDTNNGYTRTITVTDLTSSEKQVVSAITWNDLNRNQRSFSLASNITNWRNAYVAPPPLLVGNWGNPQTLGTIDLGAGLEATALAVRNKVVYMTALASSAAKSDFFIINAVDGANPFIESQLNIGSGSTAVAVSGTFAFIANQDSVKPYSIINVSVTSSPQNILTASLANSSDAALSIAVTGTYLFIGTKNQPSFKEFFPVDITNMVAPVQQSGVEIGGDINRIVLFGNRAFLATTSSTNELMILNISNPTNVTMTASINLPGTNAATGLFINPQNNRLYITRNTASGVSPEILVYSITNPDAPILINSLEFANNIPAVIAADSLLFLGTTASNLEFQTYTESTLTYSSGLNFPQEIRDMALENNVIYAAIRANDSLRIITSQ